MNNKFIEVSQSRFYEIINPHDIVVNSRYTKDGRSEFSTRQNRLIGYAQYTPREDDEVGYGDQQYFILEDFVRKQK